jgi:hypothetical protein
MAGRWRLEPDEASAAGAAAVERLLQLPLLQRLAAQRATELEIVESDDALWLIQARTVFPGFRRKGMRRASCDPSNSLWAPGIPGSLLTRGRVRWCPGHVFWRSFFSPFFLLINCD